MTKVYLSKLIEKKLSTKNEKLTKRIKKITKNINKILINHPSSILLNLILLQATFTSNIEDIRRFRKEKNEAQRQATASANRRKTVCPGTGQGKQVVSLIVGRK